MNFVFANASGSSRGKRGGADIGGCRCRPASAGPAATDAPPRTSEAPRPAWRPWLRAVSQDWAHVYPDWSFAIGQQTIDIEPVPAVGHGWSGDCLHCIGTLAGEPFVLVMEPALASALARSADAAAAFRPPHRATPGWCSTICSRR